MTFRSNDLYLPSGTANFTNSWTASVVKFDTSSFYHWEQDNIPIHDLEERTLFNWEKLGHPTSGVPGLCFLVSGDNVGASSTFFTSVSAAIEALPEVIRYPIILEIGRFGNLGKLHLDNIKCTKYGGLEIRNLAFGKFYSNSSVNQTIATDTTNNLDYATVVSSVDTSNTLAGTYSICTEESLLSATNDPRLKNNQYIFMGIPGFENRNNKRTDLIHYSKENTSVYVSANAYQLSRYESPDNTEDDTILTYDTSTFNELTGNFIKRNDTANGDPAVGFIYGNYFTEIKIENCEGPIYLRNVMVDGATGANGTLDYETDKGIVVNNSNLVLENISVTRCINAGVEINNSDVILSRGLIAHRNYNLSSATGRDLSAVTPGLRANNSTLTVSSHQYASGTDLLMMFSRNETGVELNNSKLQGGDSRGNDVTMSYFQTFWNNRAGLKANNSVVDLRGRLDVFNNRKGVVADNSQILVDEFTIEGCQNEGMLLNNTHFVYGKSKNRLAVNSNSKMEQFFCSGNGQHIVLNSHSKLEAEYASGMPGLHGQFLMQYSHGKADKQAAKEVSLPSVYLDNSEATLVHTRIESAPGTQFGSDSAVFGAAVAAHNNSTVKLQGSKSVANVIVGPNDWDDQRYTAGIYAKNNSQVDIQGPTIIAQYGVDLLAEDDSVISMTPHRSHNGSLDVSGWNLYDFQNHTKVELHSTRAGVVANRNSTFNAEDLGSFHKYWSEALVSAVEFNRNDKDGTSAYTVSGYLQFWANPQETTTKEDVGAIADTFNSNGFSLINPFIADLADVDNFTSGGVCVRLVNNSVGNVRNVHFPAGWYNASGSIYDASAGTCERLYIWNIADNSQLHASYLSVSGLYPSLAGYHGPSAFYASTAKVIASGAGKTTPDTSTVSILDIYGKGDTAGAGMGFLGQDSFLNSGPFRLFFSVMGPAKMLAYVPDWTTKVYGAPYQHLSQGYNLSSVVSSVTNLGTLYNEISSVNIPTYYHTSATLPDGVRVFVDESGADSFANARHCSDNRSGKKKVVSIYRSLEKETGEGFDSNVTGNGKGYFSSNVFDLERKN